MVNHDYRHHRTPGVRMAMKIARCAYAITVISSAEVVALVLVIAWWPL